jgi:hypothetical protein
METKKYIVRQISVFSENKPGKLAAIARAFEEEKINILAFSIAEADGFGVVRALVNHPDKAYKKLTSLGYNVAFTEVIVIRMKDEPGGLFEIARLLSEAGINMEYAYAYSGKDAAVLIVRVDNADEAVKKILSHGGNLVESSVFS